jgi:transposase
MAKMACFPLFPRAEGPRSPARKYAVRMPKRAAHRPTKLTPEMQAKIVAAIQIGNYPEIAALAAGISQKTFYRWMAEGEDKPAGHPLRSFFDDVRKAKASAEIQKIVVIAKAANESWQAAAWWLERTRPDRFSLRTRVAHEGAVSIGLEDIDVLRKSMDANANPDPQKKLPPKDPIGG